MSSGLIKDAAATPLAAISGELTHLAEQVWRQLSHGDLDRWRQALAGLPDLDSVSFDLNSDVVRLSVPHTYPETQQQVRAALQQFHPWRKGPFELFGVYVDSEWRSDLKWNRLVGHLSPLHDRLVLDVGCGNGYYAWRMIGEGAGLVLGIDPTILFMQQFEAVHRYAGERYPIHLLPLGIEQLPTPMGCFDTVFSMGVFYHRRSPFDHLLELRDTLRKGGEVVLETLVVEGAEGYVLVPPGRYAKMRNVWFIPSVATLTGWMRRAGFDSIRCVDVGFTTLQEQRSTEWMRFESLADYLDPKDSKRTVEGHPAPLRAVMIAEKA
jgi:tRNA (mo5U34)-methyltransferase